MSKPNVIVVLARCSTSPASTFGLRIEDRSRNNWHVNWAFPVPATVASREGYDRAEVTGSFSIDEGEYPGCPSCGRTALVQCGCEKMGCWDGQASVYRCPWCSTQGTVGGTITNIKAGGDI